MLPTCLKRFINGREDRPGSFISLSLSLFKLLGIPSQYRLVFFFSEREGIPVESIRCRDICRADALRMPFEADFRTRTQRGKLASLSLITFSILLLLLLALVEFSPRKFCNSCRLCSMSLSTSFLPPRVFARLVRRKGEETCCAGEEYDEIASTVKLFRCPQPILFSFSLYSFDRPNNQRSRSNIHSYFLLPLV